MRRLDPAAALLDDLRREEDNRREWPRAPAPEPNPSPPDGAPWPELDPGALHGLAGEMVTRIGPHTESDPAAILAQYLVFFGNAIGPGPYFRTEADRQRANMFMVAVGKSSKGRKGTSLGYCRRTFEAADPEWAAHHIKGGLSSGEGLVYAIRDPIEKQSPVKESGRIVAYQTEVIDPGITDKRLLVIEPEFASLLKIMSREGNVISTQVRQAWDDGNLRFLTKNNPISATGAHISIIGHVTSDEVIRCLNGTEMANGFANRFLWIAVRRSKHLPEGGSVPLADLAWLEDQTRLALAFAKAVGEMKRDAMARALWCRIYPELSRDVPGLLGALVARSEPQTMRLALLYALLDRSAEIRLEHLQAALALWDYSASSARWVFGDAIGDPVGDVLLRALIDAGDRGMSRTEIRDLFGRHRRADEVDRALALLRSGRYARVTSEPTGGRPVERWYAGEVQ